MSIELFYRTKNDEVMKQIEERKKGIWIVVDDPTKEEKQELISSYGIDPDILEDALDPYEVPRAEKEEDFFYVVTRVPLPSSTSSPLETTPLTFVIGDDFVMTLSPESQDSIIKKIKKSAITTQRTNLFFQIMSEVNKSYAKEVTLMNRDLRRQTINPEEISVKDLRSFVMYERALNDYLDALIPTNTVLETILQGKSMKLYEDDKDLIEDLSLSEEQLILRSKTLLRTIQNVRDAYTAIGSAKLNETIKLLTILTVVLTVPTMLAGLFGMNVPIPGGSNQFMFLYIVLGSAGFSGLLYLFLNKRH